MREILFCGKRIDNGKRIQGSLVIWGDDYYIAPDINSCTSMGGRGKGRCMLFGRYYQVIPETVGQYTGLTDKNGKKIFEGDIVRFTNCNTVNFTKVNFKKGSYWLVNYSVTFPVFLNSVSKENLETVGNIHDNPELLEVSK